MKNTSREFNIYTLLVVVMVATIVGATYLSGSGTALAKGIFGLGKTTATATTTLAYMTAGTATTTLVYDSFVDGASLTDSMTLLVQLTASSTNTILRINQEFANPPTPTTNCVATPGACDWYQSSQPAVFQSATTSPTLGVSLSVVPFYNWQFSSSSPGLAAVAVNDTTDSRAIPVSSPTRFTRFVFTIPVGSTNGAIWAQLVPVKQNP